MELDLSKEMPDNLGDILTMRFSYDGDNGAYDRFAKYIHRRDVPLHDKIRAWNYVYERYGNKDKIVLTSDQIKWMAQQFPSDC